MKKIGMCLHDATDGDHPVRKSQHDTDLSGKADSSHNHNASDINAGTLLHERGGLEADVNAYDGLVKISGGSTSQVTDNSTNWDNAYSHKTTEDAINGVVVCDGAGFESDGRSSSSRTIDMRPEALGETKEEIEKNWKRNRSKIYSLLGGLA